MVRVGGKDKRKEVSSKSMESSKATLASSDALPKITLRPENLRRLNDSVWEFHKPPHGIQKMDIIFFHGSQMHNDEEGFWKSCVSWLFREENNDQEAFWKTWLSRDETVVWPKVWLAEKFPEARILSISYDSSIRKSGQMDIYLVLENLVHDIIWSLTCKAGQNCPVIFAGHCFGGIIIKAFLLKCHKEASRNQHFLDPERKRRIREVHSFLQNCKAIFCYSPPSGGAKVTSKTYPAFFSGNINQQLVDFLKVLSPETARINQDFKDLQDEFEPRLVNNVIGTSKIWKSKLWEFHVTEASARQYADWIYWAPDADHFTVSRARDNTTCTIFKGLTDLIDAHYNSSSPIPIDGVDVGEEIAKKLGTTLGKLETLNPDVDWKNLSVGQILKIPDSEFGARSSTYKVVYGDTGQEIAQKLGITFAQLDAANPDENWNALYPGQVLKVQGMTFNFGQLEAAPGGVNLEDLSVNQILSVRDPRSGITNYKVVHGDNGEKIAKRFGMKLPQLEALNCTLTLRVPTNNGGGPDIGTSGAAAV